MAKTKGTSLKKENQNHGDEQENLYHWSDVAAEKVIREKGDKKTYTVAAGITPSGTVHIGNFREIITVDLVKRALEKRGKKVRFIYSWDDYDVFRKVPKNMPKQDLLLKHLRFPIVDTPDPFGCHESYARHHESEVETTITRVGINPEFLYQAKKYRSGEYADEIKKALEHNDLIKECLNEYREEDVDEHWLPITMFCERCHKDTLTKLRWLGGYTVSYVCECGHQETFDFKKKPLVKLKWRIDWPMRWNYENVDFEPGGKDHSTVGGSYDTGKKIITAVWNRDAPTYVMYDFITIKGAGGKMSSSKGDVITLKDVLEIYEPEIARYIFAGTRPNKEFAISFDADVLKVYEDFDKCERIYFGLEKVSEKEEIKQKVAYEFSYIGTIPQTIPYQPGFRHLTTLLQIHELDVEKAIVYFEKELKNEHDRKRLRARAECAKNWLLTHAPEEFTFTVQAKPTVSVSPVEQKLLHQVAEKLAERAWTDTELHEEMYILCKNNDVQPKDFFTAAYRVLINKEKGPRLASFILAIGAKKVAKLFSSA
ncbi:lysine--tRNA ligase [Candidatus Woesearchaeota archaeon]|nr:lysine--tRNA ligase [Candidatus Woesearchaeota archaeon]